MELLCDCRDDGGGAFVCVSKELMDNGWSRFRASCMLGSDCLPACCWSFSSFDGLRGSVEDDI